MRKQGSARGFCAGVIVGAMIGSAGLAAAALGQQGWAKLSQDFRVGYVTGFLQMANLARNLDPGGYIDIKYPQVPKARPVAWAAEVDRLYKDPENQKYTITSIMQLAASELEKKYGKALDPQERTRRRMEYQLQALARKREAAGLKPKDPTKQAIAPERTVKPAPPKPKEPAKPKQKKWCRCDGKDPQAERQRRRAEAEIRDQKDEQELLQRSGQKPEEAGDENASPGGADSKESGAAE